MSGTAKGKRIDRDALKGRMGYPKSLPRDLEDVHVSVDVPGEQIVQWHNRFTGETRPEVTAEERWAYQDGWRVWNLITTGYTSVGRMTVVIRKGPVMPRGGKSSSHRVFVVCPGCCAEVPAGRYQQHAGTKTCRTGDAARSTKRLLVACAMEMAGCDRELAPVPVNMPVPILTDWVRDTYGERAGEAMRELTGAAPLETEMRVGIKPSAYDDK